MVGTVPVAATKRWWGVTQFVQQYAALRWAVVAAFLVAAAIVLGRLLAPAAAAPEHGRGQGDPVPAPRGGFAESDAAHLLMCLVMLAMLVFPAGANPIAVHGVLTALTVVFAGLLLARILESRAADRAPAADRVIPLGYHTVAAAAMLYAMSGHVASGHAEGPAPVPALVLAGLFAADALLVTVAGAIFRPSADTPGYLGVVLRSGGCVAVPTGARRRWAPLPHVVMDLGTAYMLIAAVSN